MALSPKQAEVAKRALAAIFGDLGPEVKGFSIIGEGGTGKTHTVAEIARVVVEGENSVLILAPTHKALKQLQKSFREAGLSSSRIGFATLHSALGLAVLPTAETKSVAAVKDPIIGDYDLIVLDEMSMANDVVLFQYLMPQLGGKNSPFMLMMGDSYQLPPVMQVKSSAFELFECAELTENRRQLLNPDGSQNGILQTARQIRAAITNDKRFVFTGDPVNNVTTMTDREFIPAILKAFHSEADFENIRVLCWRNSRVDEINRAVRRNLFGKDCPDYVVGERVILNASIKDHNDEVVLTTGEECIVAATRESTLTDENSGDVWKVDVLTLAPCYADQAQAFARVLHSSEKDRFEQRASRLKNMAKKAEAHLRGAFWRRYYEFVEMFDDVGYCYAMTVHKSQGSTYDYTFLDVKDLMDEMNPSTRIRLLYVGWSRPRRGLIINKLNFKV